MNKTPIVAIDFDNTITLDVALWQDIIGRFQAHHWTPIVVTARRHTLENAKEIQKTIGFLPILFTDMKPKRQYAKEKGYSVDVWIDDQPERI